MLKRLTGRFRNRHEERLRPHPGPVPGADDPGLGVGGKSGALRAAVFGVNDGLLSNLSLIMGVSGASPGNHVILVAGVAGLVAGAFSMGAGEYVSMRVQRELFERLLHIEAHEIDADPQGERKELQQLYEQRGFPTELASEVSKVVMRDPKVALDTHAREELGLDPDELGSPWGAASSSFVMFAVGASIPLLPFVIGSGVAATVAAIAASAASLLGVGAVMSKFTRRNPLLSGARMLVVGTIAASVTFGVGRLLHVTTGA
jgi:VIT1/CCC1 family predicted Fe2+/Mn2+ transporter